MALSGREKATIFLSILGAETSARVLRYLPDELADLIASGINHLPTPSPAALSEVLDDFKGFIALPGSSTASPSLPAASTPPPPPPRPKRSYGILVYERPQMVAYIIALLPEPERVEALNSFPREKAIIQELISNLRKNSLSTKLEAVIKEKFKEKIFVSDQNSENITG